MSNVVETLRALREQERVPARLHPFVDSLLRQEKAWGELSGPQMMRVEQIVASLTSGGEATTRQLPSMLGVVQLLGRASAAGLKYPKLWLQLPDGTPLRVTVAGERSRTPGFLMLTDGEHFGANRYFGRISPQGMIELGRDGFPVREPLVTLLHRLATDPAAVAAEFGHITGQCCFCSLPLKDARSTAVGYGPVCAQKFGVPWGATSNSKTLSLSL